jgi:hypothetical protein
MKGENIARCIFLGSQTRNIAQISAVVSEFPVTFCDDEYNHMEIRLQTDGEA